MHGGFFLNDSAVAFEATLLLSECAFQHSVCSQDLGRSYVNIRVW